MKNIEWVNDSIHYRLLEIEVFGSYESINNYVSV